MAEGVGVSVPLFDGVSELVGVTLADAPAVRLEVGVTVVEGDSDTELVTELVSDTVGVPDREGDLESEMVGVVVRVSDGPGVDVREIVELSDLVADSEGVVVDENDTVLVPV